MLVLVLFPMVNQLVVVECSSVNPIYEKVTTYVIARVILPIPIG